MATESRHVRTKIVATIGPATRSPEMLSRLIDAGVNVFRLNFSHGTLAEHSQTLVDIRAASHAAGQNVAVLQDLCGPKIRLGPIMGDVIECPLGARFRLVNQRTSEDPNELTCSYGALIDELKLGHAVLFADGAVAMNVTNVAPGRAELEVTLPGRLRSRQGINLPNAALNVPSLTAKDLADLDWTAQNDDQIDYVGQSFVRHAADIEWLRAEMKKRGCRCRLIAKIEKPQAVENLKDIVALADAVMVARGDLGVEVGVARVPTIQKQVIALCNQVHRPVITATQMLNSMEHSNTPTRAEAADVFNAVLDGTDAVMLSGETAIGRYPLEAVGVMRRIAAEAESYARSVDHWDAVRRPALDGWVRPITEATVDAACLASARLAAPLIVVTTVSGRTAQSLSDRRPSATILAMTPDCSTARALSLCWGVRPMELSELPPSNQQIDAAVEWARSRGLLSPGQNVVLLRGAVPEFPNSNAVIVREV